MNQLLKLTALTGAAVVLIYESVLQRLLILRQAFTQDDEPVFDREAAATEPAPQPVVQSRMAG